MFSSSSSPGFSSEPSNQAQRTAWHSALDWTRSPLSIAETGQPELEEVFLVYTMVSGLTLSQAIDSVGFEALSPTDREALNWRGATPLEEGNSQGEGQTGGANSA